MPVFLPQVKNVSVKKDWKGGAAVAGMKGSVQETLWLQALSADICFFFFPCLCSHTHFKREKL